jgi:hypothetical protein
MSFFFFFLLQNQRTEQVLLEWGGEVVGTSVKGEVVGECSAKNVYIYIYTKMIPFETFGRGDKGKWWRG